MDDLTCDQVQEAAPGFALDILEPAARAGVAAHLVRCPLCRSDVTGLQQSAAELLELGSGRDAPGADGETWDCPTYAVRGSRRRLRLVVTMAAAALLVLGSTLGPEAESRLHSSPRPVARSQLLDGTLTVGWLDVYPGHNPALDLQVTDLTGHERVTCETVGRDGTLTALGSFGLYQGHGYWESNTPLDLSRVAGLILVDPAGRVLASAYPPEAAVQTPARQAG